MILEVVNDKIGCFVAGTEEQCRGIADLLNKHGFRHDKDSDGCGFIRAIYFGGAEDKTYSFYSVGVSAFPEDLFFSLLHNPDLYQKILDDLQHTINA